MSDISNQLIKDSYNYVLQSDISTGVVYRVGGAIPVNPIFLSGLTINSGFTYSNGTEQPGYVLITDAFGNASWGPVSGSSNGNYLSLSGGTVSGATIFTSGLTATTISATTYLNLPSGLTCNDLSGCTIIQNIEQDIINIQEDYVPYTGATKDVNLGVHSVRADGGFFTTWDLGSFGASPFGFEYTKSQIVDDEGRTVSIITNPENGFQSNYINNTTQLQSYIYTKNDVTLGVVQTIDDVVVSNYLTVTTTQTETPKKVITYQGFEGNYVDFKTSPTVPNPTGGTLYYDSNENALSYKPVTNQNDVTVNLGQESLIRIFNDLGSTILNGQVLHITGATLGIPTVALANASKLGTAFTESVAQTSGVATHDIPSGQFGFMTNFGIVRDLNTSAFTNGQEVFLSDTVDGALTNDPNNIAFTSRVSTVGYCLESSPTNGKILVVITNENPLQSLTQQEVNVLLGNTISTGAYFYTGTTTASTTTINVSPVRGWIVYNTGPVYSTNPLVLNVYYSGGTNLPVAGLTTSFDTYLMVTSGGTLYQTTSYPTPIERRQNIFLCRIVHPNKTSILNVEESVDFDVSPYSSLRDLWVPLKLINENVVPSPNGTTLTFKTSSGTFWGNGIGFPTNELNPNSITVPAYLPASFYYTTQTGGTFTTTTTTVDTTKYDVGGVAVNVPGSGNYTTQRIYMSQSGVIRLQYGQNYYSTLAKAIATIPSETFVTNPDNSLDCILIGLLTVKDGTGDLSNTDDAIFTFVSKFGDILGGTGGIATTTLQQAYNNSVPPEILTNSTLGALTIQNGTGNSDNVSNLIEGVNTSGTITSFIRADGLFSGNSVSTPGFTANTNGLTATTISGTTYLNLPTDIRVTGGTYSNGTTTFTNNTGGTFNVTGFTTPFTGGTVTGATSFTGGLTANTISATTITSPSVKTYGLIVATSIGYQNIF